MKCLKRRVGCPPGLVCGFSYMPGQVEAIRVSDRRQPNVSELRATRMLAGETLAVRFRECAMMFATPTLPPKPVEYRRPAKLPSFCDESGEGFAHAGLHEGVVFVHQLRVGNFRVFLRR